MSKRKSLADEIIESMEAYLERIDSGEDGHFKDGVFDSGRAYGRFALANAIGNAKAKREKREIEREIDRIDRKKKLSRKRS